MANPAVDVKRIIRLKSTIEAGATGNATLAAMELYTTTRTQIAAMLDDELRQEFVQLFPEWTRRGGGALSAAVSQGVTGSEARSRLRAMVGWLDGLIEGFRFDAQISSNSEAYARERIRAERGMGFRAEAEREDAPSID